MSNPAQLGPTPSLVEIFFHNGQVGRYADIHQILMTSQSECVFTHGSEVISIPYADIKEIKIHFS